MSRKRKHISHLSFKIFLRIGQLAKKKKQNKKQRREEKIHTKNFYFTYLQDRGTVIVWFVLLVEP